MLFVEYPACSTCRKAKQWLDERGFAYTDRHIRENNPTFGELREWHRRSGLPGMTEEEQLRLLAGDGMLVRRPVLVDGDTVLVGFRPEEWAQKLRPAAE